jgi:hypothetical protein
LLLALHRRQATAIGKQFSECRPKVYSSAGELVAGLLNFDSIAGRNRFGGPQQEQTQTVQFHPEPRSIGCQARGRRQCADGSTHHKRSLLEKIIQNMALPGFILELVVFRFLSQCATPPQPDRPQLRGREARPLPRFSHRRKRLGDAVERHLGRPSPQLAGGLRQHGVGNALGSNLVGAAIQSLA